MLFVLPYCGYSLDIKVGLFNNFTIEKYVFSIVEGNYCMVIDSTYFFEVKTGDIFYFTLVNNLIHISSGNEQIGSCNYISFNAKDIDGIFTLRPVDPAMKTRTYDGDCNLFIDINRIQAVNKLDLEKYVAGVVVAEGGHEAESEFYKTQAILCRTYALKNMEKYAYAGYNLCDDVSCQAYHGRCDNTVIIEATRQTNGLVVVGPDSTLITAAFHSNSGGCTMNSKDLWLSDLPYLQSVDDPFSVNQRNSSWQKTIDPNDWRNYLEKMGVAGAGNLPISQLIFFQNTRQRYYSVNGFMVELKTIRSDWNLKSTYFSIVPARDKLVIKGKGYGHGVGLSQEGAMNMARQGYDYKRIINFYYKNVNIVHYINQSDLISDNYLLKK